MQTNGQDEETESWGHTLVTVNPFGSGQCCGGIDQQGQVGERLQWLSMSLKCTHIAIFYVTNVVSRDPHIKYTNFWNADWSHDLWIRG